MITYSMRVTDAIGGGIAATVTCQCGESCRVQLDDEHLQAIAVAMFAAKLRAPLVAFAAALHDNRDELQHAQLLCVDFTVWLLTHATNHTEQRRRDVAKGTEHVS